MVYVLLFLEYKKRKFIIFLLEKRYIRGRLSPPPPLPIAAVSLFVVEGGIAVCVVVPAGTRGRKRS
jgi:hypothetical protein